MNTVSWCNRTIRLGFYLLFGLVPFLLTPWNYELFEFNKMIMVYILTAVIVTAWVTKSIAQREARLCRTPLDVPIALFVLSQLISAIFSMDPHVSWFGYYSRFNGGMWSIISYVLLYYAFLSNHDIWGEKKNIVPLLTVTLTTAGLVSVYGVLERLGIDKHLWVQDVQNRVFSTLGQPNWLAAYLVALSPLTWALAFRTQISERKSQQSHWSLSSVFWVLMGILFFLVLLFTRSRSGLAGFAVADIAFWAVVLWPMIRKPTDWKRQAQVTSALLFHILLAFIIFLNGTGTPSLDRYVTFDGWRSVVGNVTSRQAEKSQDAATASATPAGPALEVGGTESGTIRKYVWQAALTAWNSSWKTRLIGTGTETFAFAFYEFRPVGHNSTSEWDFLYNKAHNEYLNYLATTGILGLGSYLLFIGVFIWWFIKVHGSWFIVRSKSNTLAVDHEPSTIVNLALFAGWLSILVTNFFGFSVVILQVFLFLFPALIIIRNGTALRETVYTFRATKWILWVGVVLGTFTLLRVALLWYADTQYALGYRLIRGGLYGQAIPPLTKALAVNHSEPTYHDELGSAYATLAVAALQSNDATQAANLAAHAIDESNKALSISPENVNFVKTRTKIYYTLSALDPSLNSKAVEALKLAIPLSPNDPKIYYNLAILTGREGNADEAVTNLLKAKALKPDYRDAYYALWVFYTESKKSTEAKAVLEEYLTKVNPNDADFREKIK